MQAHVDGIFRAQSDLRLNVFCLHDWSRQQFHTPLLTDGGEQENAFHPGKSFTDAFTPAATKREVRELRSACLAFRREAIRIEA
jgi:hypothetical protein